MKYIEYWTLTKRQKVKVKVSSKVAVQCVMKLSSEYMPSFCVVLFLSTTHNV